MDQSRVQMLMPPQKSLLSQLQDLAGNQYVVGVVGVLVVAYAARYMPNLPSSVNAVLNNIVARFVMLFVVAYVITRSAAVALVCTLVALIIVLGSQLLFGKESMTNMRNVASQEGRLVENAPVSVSDGVLTEVAPLSSETVTEKVSDVVGYTNLWMNNEEVTDESMGAAVEEVMGSVEVAPTVAAATTMKSSALSSVAASLSGMVDGKKSSDVVEPRMPPVPTMQNSVDANKLASLAVEVNPDAIVGVMNDKQTNLATL